MAFIVSNDYLEQIYSGDAKHKLRIWFNNTELTDADIYCEKLTVKHRIIPEGSKSFSLDNFVSTQATLILHDIDLNIIQNPIKISISTLVNDVYEEVPIGVFLLRNTPTTDSGKTTISLLDNASKFDFNYNGKELIDNNGGSATKLQIFNDICEKAGVETLVTTFLNDTDLIGTYDNTITARTYISYLAEQSGAIPKINRDGKLIFVYLNNLTTQRIPLRLLEKYTNATPYKITRVVYEDGIRKFEAGNKNNDTLFINASNPYINNQEHINNILQLVENFEINSFTTGKVIGNPAIDPYDILEVYDNYQEGEPVIARTLATYTLTYTGVITVNYDTQIGLEERTENVSLKGDNSSLKRYVKSEIDQVNATLTLVSGEVDENGEQISQVQNSVEGLNISITDIENDVHNLSTNLSITAEGLEAKINKSGNNLLYGTALYDLSQWGWQPNAVYIEQATPPSLDAPYNWWYCTQDNGEYTNGTVYRNDGIEWVQTTYTRKDLVEGYQTNHIYILENEFTKFNFLSQKALNFTKYTDESVGLVADAYTSTKPTIINPNMENLVFSCKVQNNLQYGYLSVAFTENVDEIINSTNLNNIIYAIQKDFLRSYNSDLEEIEFTFPILTQKDVVTGYYGETEPTNQTYWFDTTNNVLKTKDSEGNWTIVGNKIFDNNGTYYAPFMNNENIFYIERSLPSLNAKSIYGTLYNAPIALGFSDGYSVISETEPEPKKGLYWAKPSADAIYYAKYNADGTFDEWELLPYTYQNAVDNTQYYVDGEYPTIPVTGNVLMGDIKLEYGTSATDWSLNENESYGQNYKLDDKGLQIQKGDYKMYIDEDEITGYYKEEIAFNLNEYRTFSKIGQFEETDQNGLITKKLSNGVYVRYIE